MTPALVHTPVIAVLRAPDGRTLRSVVECLVDAGVRSIELTMTTPNVLQHLDDVRARAGAAAEIGIGTVTDGATARAAIDHGADYLVTPTLSLEVLAEGARLGVPVVGGALTPTEVLATWAAGAAAVKVFPANLVGPGYVKDLGGPFPGLRVIPSGGIDASTGAAWLRAGAAAISVGGPLVGSVFSDGDMSALAQRAAQIISAACSARDEQVLS